jgi:hypothetical protein
MNQIYIAPHNVATLTGHQGDDCRLPQSGQIDMKSTTIIEGIFPWILAAATS